MTIKKIPPDGVRRLAVRLPGRLWNELADRINDKNKRQPLRPIGITDEVIDLIISGLKS